MKPQVGGVTPSLRSILPDDSKGGIRMKCASVTPRMSNADRMDLHKM
ncbi:hypothetical protein [Paenibacillus sp. FSL R5-0713]